MSETRSRSKTRRFRSRSVSGHIRSKSRRRKERPYSIAQKIDSKRVLFQKSKSSKRVIASRIKKSTLAPGGVTDHASRSLLLALKEAEDPGSSGSIRIQTGERSHP
ncbi:hypothetical protein AVEN_200839-1 [Araneus ventricosus]|uniref:Uncharacterized protein n=1 Tax=Araneus ventricosus TaxID=182803 RepID=A0A4Y2UUV8_ARAVE|nr:hypothetical protein AVEN_200839-1 [Araneus ventricosus]